MPKTPKNNYVLEIFTKEKDKEDAEYTLALRQEGRTLSELDDVESAHRLNAGGTNSISEITNLKTGLFQSGKHRCSLWENEVFRAERCGWTPLPMTDVSYGFMEEASFNFSPPVLYASDKPMTAEQWKQLNRAVKTRWEEIESMPRSLRESLPTYEQMAYRYGVRQYLHYFMAAKGFKRVPVVTLSAVIF